MFTVSTVLISNLARKHLLVVSVALFQRFNHRLV